MKVTRKDPEPPKPSFVLEMSYEEAEFLCNVMQSSRFFNPRCERLSREMYSSLSDAGYDARPVFGENRFALFSVKETL